MLHPTPPEEYPDESDPIEEMFVIEPDDDTSEPIPEGSETE